MMVNDYRLKWLPKADSMFISNAKDPIKFYKGTGDMHGTAILTKNGMFGKGVLITRGSNPNLQNSILNKQSLQRERHFSRLSLITLISLH